jgi:P-aminobenzoate N-oxygenase AurF
VFGPFGPFEEDEPMEMTSYTIPTEGESWPIATESVTTVFNWDYAAMRDKMTNLYRKGKNLQWDSEKRIVWTREIDRANPLGVPETFVPIYGSRVWERLTETEKGEVRLHMAAWQFSQFLHGEQGALICTAKIVETVPNLDSKFYAATQVIDEARHVESYSRYLREKIGLAYPINPHLKTLLDQVIRDRRWDFTYLGMQILIEGLALGAFGTIRDNATEPTAREINAYVMQDEARHVAFGRLALRDYYPQLSDAERREREEFAVEACYLMRDRFLAEEVWRNLDHDAEECVRYVSESELMRFFRSSLFLRIVPTLKDIGLWGQKIRSAFEDMGVMQFAALDPEQASQEDEAAAFRVEKELAAGRAA